VNRNPLTILLITLCIALLPGDAARADEHTLNIVTTTTQAYDIVTLIGGNRANVVGLMGAGVDPHLYRPTESDIAAMHQADLVIYSGLHLEGQFDEVFESLGERSIRTYALSTPVYRQGYVMATTDGSEHGMPDPHFWFDPRNWQLVTEALAGVMAASNPANADFFHANADAYIEQLDRLYAWAVEGMQQVPEAQRYIVTSHDAFQYFGDALGWQMRGLQGISTRDEAGVADVQSIAGFVAQQGIPVMFVESSVPPNAIEAVQASVRAQGVEVGIGIRELYSDAMGEPGDFGGTYIGMFAENVITILQSYGYAVPAWPEGLSPSVPNELLAMPDIAH
jgi:manganese/zinc/iron transport system substrate-binding protein